jgi:hypothetical protein
MKMRLAIPILLLSMGAEAGVESRELATNCFGKFETLQLPGGLPHIELAIGAVRGRMLVDSGTSVSRIDLHGFGLTRPPLDRNGNLPIHMFGSHDLVRIRRYEPSLDHGGAGVIGADVLARHIYTFDFHRRRIHRSGRAAFCKEAVLRGLGMRAASTASIFDAEFRQRQPGSNAVPFVPVRIGTVLTHAMIDTGFSSLQHRNGILINHALFTELERSGLKLIVADAAPVQFATCKPGLFMEAYVFYPPDHVAFEIIGVDRESIARTDRLSLLLVDSPEHARACGGGSETEVPRAIIGSTFLRDRKVALDPFSARIWIGERHGHIKAWRSDLSY